MNVTLAWKIARIVGPWIIGAIIGGVIVGKVQQVRFDAKALELAKVRQELTVCQDANTADQNTIENLKGEVKDALKGCETRLRSKEKTLSEIKMIDRITVTRGDNENNRDGDPLLDLLDGMYDAGS